MQIKIFGLCCKLLKINIKFVVSSIAYIIENAKHYLKIWLVWIVACFEFLRVISYLSHGLLKFAEL
jgi:hypothetical protein